MGLSEAEGDQVGCSWIDNRAPGDNLLQNV
jgi:hypothetical protein